jgi:hypothetical protein
MYAAHTRYLAVAFVDAESVRPNQEEITALLGAFPDLQLVPMAIQEVQPSGQGHRIGFISEDGAWQIVLLSKQFNVARVAKLPIGGDLGKFPAFCEQANTILKWVLNRFDRQPHRLAAVQEGVLKQKSEDEIEVISKRLLRLPDTFKKSTLGEWDWRAATKVSRRIGEHEEILNTIAAIKKYNGLIGQSTDPSLPIAPLPTKFSLIRADIDINTSEENTSARFQDAYMDSFFKEVVTWHEELIAEINRLINEG